MLNLFRSNRGSKAAAAPTGIRVPLAPDRRVRAQPRYKAAAWLFFLQMEKTLSRFHRVLNLPSFDSPAGSPGGFSAVISLPWTGGSQKQATECPVGDREFRACLDDEGRLLKPQELRLAVYKGGVEPSLRKVHLRVRSNSADIAILEGMLKGGSLELETDQERTYPNEQSSSLPRAKWNNAKDSAAIGEGNCLQVIWKHILNVYPEGLTGRERLAYMRRKSDQYIELRTAWKAFVENPAFSGDIQSVINMVRKDVLRTDRSHPFYEGEDDNRNVVSLFNLLTTFALNHPSLSYCQGMSDLASPLLVVMRDESHAYVCFCALMRRLGPNFDVDGEAMTLKFKHLSDLVQYYDSTFFR
ncbi:hypothetical protein HPB51_010290 [Rhipicephalus microplus]|uniref:Rab-GAP TBC domain-containing protein n=1 Tax=Rhipicephalus microplus TaxID=6941 RepID=A0A9J6D4U0_RHIMP|nr:hypothetical protein HPB51_010290 [Rhipicephalus microplus]